MDIAQESRALLETHGYATAALVPTGRSFSFEDANLLGGAFVYDDLDQLLEKWEPRQDQFLAEFAGRLRSVPEKLWNIYTVHLTSGRCDPARSSALFSVEENFRGTRKIARSGLQTKDDVKSALLALLPIQSMIDVRDQDVDQLVQDRLKSIHPAFSALFSTTSATELAARLLEHP